MPYCTECGAEIKEGAQFCPNCGTQVAIRSREKTQVTAPARAPQAEAAPMVKPAPREAPRGRAKFAASRKILSVAVILIVVGFVVAAYALTSGGGDNWPTTTTTTTTAAPTNNLGVLDGAANYIGTYPEPEMVSYAESGGLVMSVLAYPGQVQVFFDKAVTQQYAEDSIRASGGEVIGAIPLAGYYLVQVDIGSEASFILDIMTDPMAYGAMPNLALAQEDAVPINEDYFTTAKPVPLNVHGPVAIDSGWHGESVQSTALANGGVITDIVNVSNLNGLVPSDKWKFALNAIAQGNAIFNPGETTFINISQGAGYHDDALSGDTNNSASPDNPTGLGDWSDWANLPPDLQQVAINNRISFMMDVFRGVQGLPEDLFDSTYITMSGGNNNMPLEPVLSTLRGNPAWDMLLQDTVAIVTCPTSLYNQANQATPGDPSVVVMNNPQAAYGTSYAAPAANAAIQHLTGSEIMDIRNATGATFAQVVQAAEMAKGANPDGQVVASEVAAMAAAVVSGPAEFGNWSGTYVADHTEGTDPYTRHSSGTIFWSNVTESDGSFTGDLTINGIQVLNTDTGQLMWIADGCAGTVSGSFSDASNFSGTLSFTVSGTLSPPRSWPFTATLSGYTLEGTISGGNVSGFLALSRQ